MKQCKCGKAIYERGIYLCSDCRPKIDAQELERRLVERIAREPKGEPFSRELATTKLLIAEAHAMGDARVVLLNLKQLVSLSKSRAEENKAAGRTVGRDALGTTRRVFCVLLQTVFWGYPDSAQLPPLVANGPFDYDGVGIEIFLEKLFAGEDRASIEIDERDFFVANGAPDRADYEQWLRLEPPSRFAEASALAHLEYEHWFRAGDRVLVEGFSKSLAMLSRAGRSLSEFERDFYTPTDLQLKQDKLVAWISQIPEQPPETTAALWRSDVLTLCCNFAETIRFIINERLDEKARDMLLDKFVMPGAATCYPMLYAEGGK